MGREPGPQPLSTLPTLGQVPLKQLTQFSTQSEMVDIFVVSFNRRGN